MKIWALLTKFELIWQIINIFEKQRVLLLTYYLKDSVWIKHNRRLKVSTSHSTLIASICWNPNSSADKSSKTAIRGWFIWPVATMNNSLSFPTWRGTNPSFPPLSVETSYDREGFRVESSDPSDSTFLDWILVCGNSLLTKWGISFAILAEICVHCLWLKTRPRRRVCRMERLFVQKGRCCFYL